MKKFFILTIISILCLSFLTACGPATAPPDFTPYWGQLINNDTGKDYLEYSEYKIEVKSLTDEKGKPLNETEYKLDPAYSSGTYTTVLTHQKRNEGETFSIYELENIFEFTGRYNKNGTLTEEFTDSFISKVAFKVNSQEFTTLSSEKTVKQASFIDLEENFKQISYTVTNTYADKNVTSKLEFDAAKKDNADVFKEIKNTTYTANLGDSYFDNESLFLGIRSRKPHESFSLSYNIINPIDQVVKNMQAAYVAQKVDEDDKVKPIKLASIGSTQPTITGTKTTEVECYMVQAKITGNNSGAPINLYFAKGYKTQFLDKSEITYNEAYYYFLVKYEHGDMVYTLNTFDNNARTKVTEELKNNKKYNIVRSTLY